ncbi:hypothetical protein OV450_3538 [Actinobacteria bacterium OV450]|nr:hypothetical protein OV450_3538 [Actinobacteria bacterium OV450]
MENFSTVSAVALTPAEPSHHPPPVLFSLLPCGRVYSGTGLLLREGFHDPRFNTRCGG